MCDNLNIKELLPGYAVQSLDQPSQKIVEKHLESCEDCRTELVLLRMMAEEAVPDPGEAYWATMPDRVYRAVSAQKAQKRTFDPAWLTDRLTVPRWAVATAVVSMVLMISWFVVRPPQKIPAIAGSTGYEFADENTSAVGVPINALDRDQFDMITAWAGNELTLIARETEHSQVNGADTDLDEELTELDSQAAKRLSSMLDRYKQEG